METNRKREEEAIEQAKREGRCVSYVDNDGCEITATPEGHIFYNVTDWF
jgi:hypothetical protein